MNYLYIYNLEIKNRIFVLLICWVFTSVTCYFYKETLLFVFISFSNYITLSNSKPYFIFTNVTEIFSVYTELIFFVSNQVLFIKLCYHSLTFLSFGLYKLEYSNLKFAFKVFAFTWITSTIILNKAIVPISWHFFLSFQEPTSLKTISLFFEAKLGEYFKYYTDLYYLCFLNCLLLMCISLLINKLSNNPIKVKSFRKMFYYLFVIFSTLATPPDVWSQILTSLILICVYEILILIKLTCA